MKLLRMEFFKCRRRKIALICLAFVAVQLAWMGRTLTQMEPGELTQGWMSLLYNLAVIDPVAHGLDMLYSEGSADCAK